MTVAGWIEIVLFLAVLTALTPSLGGYMARVFRGEPVLLAPVLAPVERAALPPARRRPRSAARTGRATRAPC